MKTIKYIIIAILISSVLVIVNAVAGENNLVKLLPQGHELGKNITAEYQQKAEGEKLIDLINGGAVLYFKHGFKQTVFQEYYIDSTQYINLEIYQMNDPEGAKGIFLARTDTTAEKIRFGHQGFQGTYYCTFYRSNYYVIATGSDTTDTIRQVLLKSTEVVDHRIKNILRE